MTGGTLTRSWHERALQVTPGGVHSPVRAFRAMGCDPVAIVSAHGARLTSADGREYIDYHLSSGPVLLGHAHPAITAAVNEQLPKGTTYFFLNEPEIRLAKRLVDAIPCGEVVHYTGSGTEATFYALRIARAQPSTL